MLKRRDGVSSLSQPQIMLLVDYIFSSTKWWMLRWALCCAVENRIYLVWVPRIKTTQNQYSDYQYVETRPDSRIWLSECLSHDQTVYYLSICFDDVLCHLYFLFKPGDNIVTIFRRKFVCVEQSVYREILAETCNFVS